IMWAVSEIPTFFYAILMATMWMQSEDRRARQFDRKADRDGGAELEAYNAYLASLRGEAPSPAASSAAGPSDAGSSAAGSSTAPSGTGGAEGSSAAAPEAVDRELGETGPEATDP